MVIEYLTEGPKTIFSSWKQRFSPKAYQGSANEICTEIVKACWNGKYFQTSAQNFTQFWVRDFGWCTKALMDLGYKEEVHKTLKYALNRFKEHHKITTTIAANERPFDFPVPAVDSLPWLIHSIRISRFVVYPYQNFLNKEIEKFFQTFINPQTGIVKPELHVSSIKDQAIRKSSCYDNCMVALLAKDLKSMNLYNPFDKIHYPELLKRHFWNGKFFYDDLSKPEYVAGDANLFPFALGIINDEEMLKSSLAEIHRAGLDSPYPLKYTSSRKHVKFVWQELLMRNYESDAIWMHMGLLYVKLFKTMDKEKATEIKQKYQELIEQLHGFPKVLTADGKPYTSLFYTCDRSMLWAANYLML